ncbi:MAG: MBL fold metallo-hydrolase [Actinobacteria bacterium HGW-Actinobacteria-7]|nr:MAG: MBL fold metallo-hydrolase [Actinobacteria bacterium HGW-Actinobacteria-7]
MFTNRFGERTPVPQLPVGAQKIAGATHYVPGLTNSGFINGLVIDTGPDCDVYEAVAIDTLAITHGHADHFSAGAEIRRRTGARVLASRDDARLVENPEVNIRGMFSWARPGDLLVSKLFLGVPCPVDDLVEMWEDSRATPVALPGHTLGHTGYLTTDKVLFTGDALYQKEIWERHRLPYAIDPAMVADSLAQMLALDFDWLVPGHGVCCSREEAEGHIAFHLKQISQIEHFILDALATEHTTEDVIALVSEDRGLSDNPAQYWLAVTTVKGYLGTLLGKGQLEFFVREHAGWWRTPR